MIRAAFAVLFTLVLGADAISPVVVWPNMALTDGEGRILGMLIIPSLEEGGGDPKFGTGIWADTAEKSPLKLRPRIGLAMTLHKRGEWLQGQGRFDEASASYQMAQDGYLKILSMTESPDYGRHKTEAQLGLATLYATVNEFGDAESLIQDVLREQPDHLPAIVKLAYVRMFLASVFTSQGRHEDARMAYRAALDATNLALNRRIFDYGMSFGVLFSYRAQAHAALGDCDSANREFEFASRQDPDIPLQRCQLKKGD